MKNFAVLMMALVFSGLVVKAVSPMLLQFIYGRQPFAPRPKKKPCGCQEKKEEPATD